MTDDEIKTAIETALTSALSLAKGLFPCLHGHGLNDLSQDQRIFTEAVNKMEERLVETNRDGNYYIDEGDRKIGRFNLAESRRRFTK